MGGAYDIGRLDGAGANAVDGANVNGGVPHEFYHTGKNKGTLRFDRY